MQYDYKHRMNGWSQATAGVEFNCKAAVAPITLYISFNKRRRLENEGLVNLTKDTGRELDSPAPRAMCYPLLYAPVYMIMDRHKLWLALSSAIHSMHSRLKT